LEQIQDNCQELENDENLADFWNASGIMMSKVALRLFGKVVLYLRSTVLAPKISPYTVKSGSIF
jgi:hypothetical protein